MDYDWFTTLHRLKKDVIDFLEHSSVMMKCVACQMHLIEFLLPERTDVVYSLLFSIAATIYNHSEYSACASRLTQIYRALHNMDDPGEQNRKKNLSESKLSILFHSHFSSNTIRTHTHVYILYRTNPYVRCVCFVFRV